MHRGFLHWLKIAFCIDFYEISNDNALYVEIIGKTMRYNELTENQSRILIDAKQYFEAYKSARKIADSYAGTMHWKKVGGKEYLIKSTRGIQRGVGARSADTERIYEQFASAKALADDRLSGSILKMAEHAKICRAVGLARMPKISSNILRAIDTAGLLGETLLVIGTNSLYAYESCAGVRFDSDIMETADMDLLFDSRKKISMAVRSKISESGLMGLLQKTDPSFAAVYRNGFRAVNRDGYFVDLVKPEPTPPWRKEPEGLSETSVESLDLVAVPIRSLHWLLSSPKITEVVIGSDGAPAPMVCADPRSFALHKLWLSSQLSRDPLKKSRDHAQAMAVASMVIDKMPHLLFDANDLKNFPKAISEDTDGSEFSALRKAFKL
ncbi:nucleotidyltransferase domain-containing protein [Ferrovum sp.]|jgi:hypothetical protein|uniref:nucleotidyltransferase domain-containing protein n=1 Tax=Ferrovum sp. TaxID=2609467 RepID=UPI00262C06ED|nr:nucleotidyltransferase domain-containing protein [Ferrovum sp.]